MFKSCIKVTTHTNSISVFVLPTTIDLYMFNSLTAKFFCMLLTFVCNENDALSETVGASLYLLNMMLLIF